VGANFVTGSGSRVAFGRFRSGLGTVVSREAGVSVVVRRISVWRGDRSGEQAESLARIRIAGVGARWLAVWVDHLEGVRFGSEPGELMQRNHLIVVNDVHLNHAIEEIVKDVKRVFEHVQLTGTEMHHPVQLLGFSAVVVKRDPIDVSQPGIHPKQTFAGEVDCQTRRTTKPGATSYLNDMSTVHGCFIKTAVRRTMVVLNPIHDSLPNIQRDTTSIVNASDQVR